MRNYFCGWYYKCQNDAQTVALIPAFHITDGVRSCSIQLITDEASWTIHFSDQQYQKQDQIISIGNNHFDRNGLTLDIHTPELKAFGKLEFGEFTPIRYDIMGPFRFAPFMECRHSVFSIKHCVNGELTINGKPYRFSNGVGYMEGDRGRSFPSEYVWAQCCFPEGSFMLSVARIPMGRCCFTGVISVIHWHGQEYRLATYLGAKPAVVKRDTVVIRQGNRWLTVRIPQVKTSPLAAPSEGKMNRIIYEAPSCEMHCQFRKKGEIMFEFVAKNASFECEILDNSTGL